MNSDMPWVNLTQKEINELRNKKHELTEYGKQRLRELMRNQEPYDADKFAEENSKERSNRILSRYNQFYNMEVSGLSHGMATSMEQLQCITLECMIDALRCENMNVEYDTIAIDDIKDLIARLYEQSNEFLKRVKEFKDSADGVA